MAATANAAAPSGAGVGVTPSAAAGADTVWVDVRTPAEYAAGHVRGAVNIAYDQMEQRWSELERYRGRPIVVYCRSGHRASIALQVLQAHGFTTASNGGGLAALSQRGEPVCGADKPC